MRPLQCPSCGHSLAATAPGPGGRRTCARCHFSFVPLHGPDLASERLSERYPALLLAVVAIPFVVAALLQYFAPNALRNWLEPRRGEHSAGTTFSTGSGEAPEKTQPPSRAPSVKATRSTTLTRPTTMRYPAVVERVVPLPADLEAQPIPLPGDVAPPIPPVPPGAIEITSNPSGASVFDDRTGIGYGSTPLRLELAPGEYRFRLQLPGRKAKVADMTLGAGDIRRIAVDLIEEAAPGLLLIDSEPIQAEVYRDGSLIGATPLSLEVPGGRDVQLLLRKAGYDDLVITARVPPGGRQNMRAILPPLPSSDQFVGQPSAELTPEELARRLTQAQGTAPPVGPFKAALPVQGSASLSPTPTTPFDPNNEGHITGLVRLTDDPPPIEFVAVTLDQATCGSAARASEKLIVAPNRSIQNVVVRLVGPDLDKLLGPPVVHSTLQIVDCRFLPHVQAIPVGTVVKFSNLNLIPFKLRFIDQAGRTAELPMEAGRTDKPLTFKTPDVYRVFEGTGHPWMGAYIHVMSNPYFAITDAGGLFTLRSVPKGDYVLETWHELLGVRTQPISVTANQTTTALIEYVPPGR